MSSTTIIAPKNFSPKVVRAIASAESSGGDLTSLSDGDLQRLIHVDQWREKATAELRRRYEALQIDAKEARRVAAELKARVHAARQANRLEQRHQRLIYLINTRGIGWLSVVDLKFLMQIAPQWAAEAQAEIERQAAEKRREREEYQALLKAAETQRKAKKDQSHLALTKEYERAGFARFSPRMLIDIKGVDSIRSAANTEDNRRCTLSSSRRKAREWKDTLLMPVWDRRYVWVESGDATLTRAISPYVIREDGEMTKWGLRTTARLVLRRDLEKAEAALAETAEKRAAARRRKQDREYRVAEAEIREQFPSIPERDLKEILNHSFSAGAGTVGRTSTLDLEEKCRLAVIAHVRHSHTDYEALMNETGGDKLTCRDAIWNNVEAVLDEWSDEEVVAS